MKGQVLHLMVLHYFMEGVFEVGVFVSIWTQRGGHAGFVGVYMRLRDFQNLFEDWSVGRCFVMILLRYGEAGL